MTQPSRFLKDGKTPEGWVAASAAMCLKLSERALRERARKLGAWHVLGQAVIIMPDQFDRNMEDAQCRSNLTGAETSGEFAAASTTMGALSWSHTAAALKRLQKLARGIGPAKKKPELSVVQSSGWNRKR